VRHHRVVPRGEACGQRGCLRRPNSRAKHYVRIHVRPTPRVSENQPSPLPGFQPLKVVRRRCSRLQVYARHCLPGAKINQSEKSSRDAPAGGSGGVSALRHWRDRQREEHCLLATKAPPTPPQRWRARSKGVKQINMAIGTVASAVPLARGGTLPSDVHSSCSRATSDPAAFQNKSRD
jgi:hypothetical protein